MSGLYSIQLDDCRSLVDRVARMLVNQQDIERGIAPTQDRDSLKSSGFSFWRRSPNRRFLTIADWIASAAVLDINPQLYTADCDRYSDRGM